MLDPVLRRQFDGPLAPVAAWLQARKIRSLALTLSAFLCGAGAMLDIAHRNYLFGLGLLVASALFDALDGPVARREVVTPFGAYLDLVLSLTISAGIAFAFALAEPTRALAAMFLMLGLVTRAAAQSGALRAAQGGLAIALERTAGLVGKSELFLAFALACLFPDWFSLIAYATGILCFIAAGSSLAALAAQRT